VAQQNGQTFQPYQTQAGDKLDMLELGTLDAETMFKVAHERNKMLTWILRGAGAAAMFFGLMLISGPLSTLFDVIPFMGSLVGGVSMIAAGMLTIALSMATVGVAWVFYRPLIGVPLLVASVGVLVLFGAKKRSAA